MAIRHGHGKSPDFVPCFPVKTKTSKTPSFFSDFPRGKCSSPSSQASSLERPAFNSSRVLTASCQSLQVMPSV